MKIETLTPQIIALYLGQKCDFEHEGKTVTGDIWGVFSSGVIRVTRVSESIGNEVEYNTRTFEQITPHLRPLSSLTEAEALELYEMVTGEKWKQIFEKQADECLPLWVFDDVEDLDIRGIDLVIGNPTAWLYLLSKGFDLLGLIDAGLAKEITN